MFRNLIRLKNQPNLGPIRAIMPLGGHFEIVSQNALKWQFEINLIIMKKIYTKKICFERSFSDQRSEFIFMKHAKLAVLNLMSI